MNDWMNYRGRDMPRVLVIHPKVSHAIAEYRSKKGLSEVPISELEYGSEEVAEIVNRLGAKLLPGNRATIHALLDILHDGWDIIWLVTHGVAEGWFLSDGLVNASEMTSLIRSSGTFLTVMNTCASIEVAETAAEELGTAFICTVREVPDRQAYITGVLFAQQLAAGLDYVEAFREARPGQDNTYRLIEARLPMMPERPSSRSSRGDFPDSETIRRLIRSMEEMERVVYGLPNMKVPALREMTDELKKDMDEIKATLVQVQAVLAEVRASQQQRNKWFIYLFIAIVALTITVGAFFLKGT